MNLDGLIIRVLALLGGLTLAAATLIVVVLLSPLGDTMGTFSPADEHALRETYPGGQMVSDRLFQACVRGNIVKFWANGLQDNTTQTCWK